MDKQNQETTDVVKALVASCTAIFVPAKNANEANRWLTRAELLQGFADAGITIADELVNQVLTHYNFEVIRNKPLYLIV